MKKRKINKFHGFLLAGATVSLIIFSTPRGQAQNLDDIKGLPGSLYVNAGNLSPVEDGNFVAGTTVEQGITLWRNGRSFIGPFGSLSLNGDTDSLDWNNRYVGTVGVKYSLSLRNGVVNLGAGWSAEGRTKSGDFASHPTLFANTWFGWDMPSTGKSGSDFFTETPGSFYGTVGTLSPFEKNNLLAIASFQQGVAVARAGDVRLVPYGQLDVSTDRFGYDWNNRYSVSGGLKVVIPYGSSSFEIGPAYRSEFRWKSDRRDQGLVMRASFWFGWNPSWNVPATPKEVN